MKPKKPTTKWKAIFRRKGEKDILAGDAYIIEATDEKEALKLARKQVKDSNRWDIRGCKFVYAIPYDPNY